MILSFLIFFPILAGLVVLLLPNHPKKNIIIPGIAGIELLFSLGLLPFFNTQTAGLQFVEQYQWISFQGIFYFLGIDGLSLSLVILTTFLMFIISLYSWRKRSLPFLASFLFLESFLIGSFVSLDVVLFYIFFELSLLPMYFIVGLWGGERKIYASFKLLIYTLFGSLLLLLSILYIMYLSSIQLGAPTASLLDWYTLDFPFVAGTFFSTQTILFASFALAFAVKVPLFPVHTWLPDAHVEAPTEGSMILAGVMLKLGVYGFFRFVLPLFPDATEYYAWLFIVLGVVGVIYGAFLAMAQNDLKKLIAYSSISHMGYVIIGLFSLNIYGLTGSFYQMLNHGITSSVLFFLVGLIYYKTHTREIKDYGGLASIAPVYSILFFLVLCASISVPLTNGFIGEFFILMGVFIKNPPLAYLSVLGVVLGAVYMLWMYKRVFFGKISDLYKNTKETLDISFSNMILASTFVVLIFWMGIFPNHFLQFSKKSLEHLSNNYTQYRLEISDLSEDFFSNRNDKKVDEKIY